MKRNRQIILLCIIFLFACNNKKKLQTDVEGVYFDIPQDTLTELLSIARFDSTLTENELAIKKKLNKLLEKYLKVIDNHFVLDALPEDFEKAGLSKYYYPLYLKSFREVNLAIDSLGIKDLEEKFKEGSIEKGFTLFSTEEEK